MDVHPICAGGAQCEHCRDREAGRAWRESVVTLFPINGTDPDFPCPHGKEWGWQGDDGSPGSADLPRSRVPRERRRACRACAEWKQCGPHDWSCALIGAPCKWRRVAADPANRCPLGKWSIVVAAEPGELQRDKDVSTGE